MVPALAAVTMDGWMEKLNSAEAIPILPRRYQDQITITNSMPKYLVEPVELCDVVEAVISSLDKDAIWAVLTDFGNGEDRQHPHL
jgi:hypothetical protein